MVGLAWAEYGPIPKSFSRVATLQFQMATHTSARLLPLMGFMTHPFAVPDMARCGAVHVAFLL